MNIDLKELCAIADGKYAGKSVDVDQVKSDSLASFFRNSSNRISDNADAEGVARVLKRSDVPRSARREALALMNDSARRKVLSQMRNVKDDANLDGFMDNGLGQDEDLKDIIKEASEDAEVLTPIARELLSEKSEEMRDKAISFADEMAEVYKNVISEVVEANVSEEAGEEAEDVVEEGVESEEDGEKSEDDTNEPVEDSYGGSHGKYRFFYYGTPITRVQFESAVPEDCDWVREVSNSETGTFSWGGYVVGEVDDEPVEDSAQDYGEKIAVKAITFRKLDGYNGGVKNAHIVDCDENKRSLRAVKASEYFKEDKEVEDDVKEVKVEDAFNHSAKLVDMLRLLFEADATSGNITGIDISDMAKEPMVGCTMDITYDSDNASVVMKDQSGKILRSFENKKENVLTIIPNEIYTAERVLRGEEIDEEDVQKWVKSVTDTNKASDDLVNVKDAVGPDEKYRDDDHIGGIVKMSEYVLVVDGVYADKGTDVGDKNDDILNGAGIDYYYLGDDKLLVIDGFGTEQDATERATVLEEELRVLFDNPLISVTYEPTESYIEILNQMYDTDNVDEIEDAVNKETQEEIDAIKEEVKEKIEKEVVNKIKEEVDKTGVLDSAKEPLTYDEYHKVRDARSALKSAISSARKIKDNADEIEVSEEDVDNYLNDEPNDKDFEEAVVRTLISNNDLDLISTSLYKKNLEDPYWIVNDVEQFKSDFPNVELPEEFEEITVSSIPFDDGGDTTFVEVPIYYKVK